MGCGTATKILAPRPLRSNSQELPPKKTTSSRHAKLRAQGMRSHGTPRQRTATWAKKSYGKSYVTQLFSAADNGGCGKSTYIGRGGEPVKNQAFNTALNYPFILTYNNAKATPLDADAEAAMKNAGSKDTFDGAV